MKESSLLKLSRFFPLLYLMVTVVPLFGLIWFNNERVNHINDERRTQISGYLANNIHQAVKQNLRHSTRHLHFVLRSLTDQSETTLERYEDILGVDETAWLSPDLKQSNPKRFATQYATCLSKLKPHFNGKTTVGSYCLLNGTLTTVHLLPITQQGKLLASSEAVPLESFIPPGPHQAEFFVGSDTQPPSRFKRVGFEDHYGHRPHHLRPPHFDRAFAPPPHGEHKPFPRGEFHLLPDRKSHGDRGSESPPPFNPDVNWRHRREHPHPPFPTDKAPMALEKTGRHIIIPDIDGKPVATIVLKLPQHPPHAKEESSEWIAFFILISGLISSVAISMYVQRTFIAPLTRLSLLSQQVESGHLGQRVSVDGVLHPEVQNTLVHFNQMLDGLEEKEKLRHNFISNLTHDFRTPLIAQARALELLIAELPQESHLDAGESSSTNALPLPLLKSLLSNNEHLLGMVNQLLETYQFESGQLKLNLETLSLTEIVDNSFTQLSPLANQRAITLTHDFPSDFPAITGDAACLSRVFINLIGNALENIPRGSHINISAEIASQNANMAVIHVRDNGQGLPDDMINSLFDRYSSGSGDTRKLGSGLGLYICKMFVEAHGGSIEVDSVIGSHTEFRIRLPINPT